MPISSGRWSLFRVLQGAHAVTTFSQLDVPPRLFGTTWSTVRRLAAPQYWQAWPSRANTARREIRRAWNRGTRT